MRHYEYYYAYRTLLTSASYRREAQTYLRSHTRCTSYRLSRTISGMKSDRRTCHYSVVKLNSSYKKHFSKIPQYSHVSVCLIVGYARYEKSQKTKCLTTTYTYAVLIRDAVVLHKLHNEDTTVDTSVLLQNNICFYKTLLVRRRSTKT